MKKTVNSTFYIGQRVQMTPEAIQQRIAPWGRTGGCFGTVTATNPPLGVSVKRDGTKMPRQYHVKFWTAKDTNEHVDRRCLATWRNKLNPYDRHVCELPKGHDGKHKCCKTGCKSWSNKTQDT